MKYTCRDQLRDIFGEGLVRRYDWWAQIGSCEVSITGDRALVGDVQWRQTVKRALSSGKLRIDCESLFKVLARRFMVPQGAIGQAQIVVREDEVGFEADCLLQFGT